MNDHLRDEADPLDEAVNPADTLTPEISARGFAHMPALAGLYGGTVRVYESSSAEHDALWVSVIQDHGSRLDKTTTEATIHLDMGAALTLTDQIRALAATRGYLMELPPDQPPTWRHVVRAFRAAGWAWRGHAGPARTANPLGDDGRPDRKLGSVTVTRARGRWRVDMHAPGLVATSIHLIDPTPTSVLEYAASIALIRNPALTEADARAHIWREVASWIRHRCKHQFGVPVCIKCVNLGAAIEQQAIKIGGTPA